MAADDRYTIPGSGGVLRNKLGLTTKHRVDYALNAAATAEWAVIIGEPIPDLLDQAYLCSIHRRLFSSVLDWAGELRRAGDEVGAGGTGIVYARAEFFRHGLDDVFGMLGAEDYLTGLRPDDFAERLAERWGYLTMTHPFRDGNTRSQSAYIDRLAVRAGHPINWPQVDVPTLIRLRLQAVTGSEKPLAAYLRERFLPAQPASG